MSNLSTSDIENIKEKLVKFKNEVFNNNKTKKDPNECKGIKYIRYLFNEDKNKKTNLYKAQKMKNLAVKNINRNKVQYVSIDQFKEWLKELREVIDQERIIKKELRKEIDVLK